MKKAAALLLALTVFFSGAEAHASVQWQEGYDAYKAALKEQKKTGKPVLLYFYTTWCPTCRKFDKKTFSDPAVVKFLEPFMKVRIDAEKEDDLAYDYNIEAYPTFYVLLKGGMREIPQYSNPESFIREARDAGLE